jgi:elongation factor Tu
MAGISENSGNKKPHMNIGTIGHVDHGKTTLAAAITKAFSTITSGTKAKNYEQIDSAPEERKRGITINASHVEVESKNRHYSLIDCPGHADYIKNMISGASQMDGAILVISSADGTMPQTEEHLRLAKQIGIPKIVVFINDKTPKGIEEDESILLKEDAKGQLEKYGYNTEGGDETPIIIASALKSLRGDKDEEAKIVELIDTVDNHISLPTRDSSSPFFMSIEGVLTVKGQGTVVTGRVKTGTLKIGQSLEIMGCKGGTKPCKVKGIEMFHKSLEQAEPGQDIGICINVDCKDPKEEINRGNYLVTPGSVKTNKKFVAVTYILTPEEGGRKTPFRSGYRPQFFICGNDFTGTMYLPEGKEINPGEYLDDLKVELDKATFVGEGESIIIREGNKTIAQAKIKQID